MFKKTILNKFKLFLGTTLSAIAILSSPVSSIIANAADNTDIEVCAEYREWIYQVIDGKMYKALYNASTGLLETDWIYVCDWPPEE